MSSNPPGPRPRQVTIGGWLGAVASAMLVVSVFDTMAGLHSVDTRDTVTEMLTGGAGRGLGLSVDDALGLIRGALFVTAAAAVVTGILGIFVLQRDVTARLVLTVAAVPIVLTAPVAGGVLAMTVGFAAALLWTRPARDWFAGRAPAPTSDGTARDAGASRDPLRPSAASWPPPAHPRAEAPVSTGPRLADLPPPRPADAAPEAPPAPVPPPTHGWGERSREPEPVTVWAPPASTRTLPQVQRFAPARGTEIPVQVRIACLLTWLFSGLTAAVYLLVIAAVAVDREGVLELIGDSRGFGDTSLNDDQLVGVLVALSALVVLWCVIAGVLAALTWRRHAWARVALLVSVGVALLVELLALPYSVVHFAAAVAAFALLRSAPVRAWFEGGGDRSGGSDASWPPPEPPAASSTYPPPAAGQGAGQGSGQVPEPTDPGPPPGKPPVW